MAAANATKYEDLNEAKAACAAENEAVRKAGLGKDRTVYAIYEKDDTDPAFYVVTTVAGKARAAASLALGIKAVSIDRKRRPTKSLVDQVKNASPDELAKLKALLAQMES